MKSEERRNHSIRTTRSILFVADMFLKALTIPACPEVPLVALSGKLRRVARARLPRSFQTGGGSIKLYQTVKDLFLLRVPEQLIHM